MRAEILSYSRTRGLFVGLSLEGAVVKQDKDGNQNLYGERVDPRRLLLEGAHAVPMEARGFLSVLENASPRPSREGSSPGRLDPSREF
jgi:lipid-binding SYLF domain-containing protein